MAEASEQERTIEATDLPGAPRVPRRCRQRVPHAVRCVQPVDFVCDHCGKSICRSHTRLASMPREVDRAADRCLRAFEAPALDLCETCARCEKYYEISIEEITGEQWHQWRASDDAVGYLAPDAE